jgi:hypothetical protein
MRRYGDWISFASSLSYFGDRNRAGDDKRFAGRPGNPPLERHGLGKLRYLPLFAKLTSRTGN